MSQVYNLEPPTKGKVVLHTTHGDIEVELWPKEAPKAVRNFCQLCMEGYYDGSIFHRVIKDFMVQSGDPTGTGKGGESIYGRPFKDEFHSRLKFNRRGLVACASAANQANSNGSQFFINTERADHLDRVSTIFGRVAGDTIFTVVRISEVEVDESDRPVDPPRVLSSDVLWPPFDDIVPRTTPAQKKEAADARARAKAAAEVAERKKTGKKLNVLSFGDEAEDDEDEAADQQAAPVRFRSAHETLGEDSRLESAEAGVHDAHVEQLQRRLLQEQEAKAELDAQAAALASTSAAARGTGADAFEESMRSKVQARRKHDSDAAPAAYDRGTEGAASLDDESGDDAAPDSTAERPRKLSKVLKMRPGGGTSQGSKGIGKDAALLNAHGRAVAAVRAKKLQVGDRQESTMSKLLAFKNKLKAAGAQRPAQDRAASNAPASEAAASAYDGKVDKNMNHRAYLPAAWRVGEFSDSEDEDIESLRNHKLIWNPDDGVADPNKRRDDADDYKVVDPLLEAGKAKFNKKSQAAKKRGNEWAGKANI